MKLKELFIDWLTESRYIKTLERHSAEIRADFTHRLSEKDTLIRMQRIEIALLKQDNEQMRLVLMPLGSPAGKLFADKFQNAPTAPVPQDWQAELNKMLEEEDNGIRSRRRIQEHEQSTDDGA